MDFEITDFTAKQINRGLLSSDFQDAHVATVTFDTGDVFGVSRFHDEDQWIVDSAIRANSFPVFVHGEGSRVTNLYTLSNLPEVENALNERIES